MDFLRGQEGRLSTSFPPDDPVNSISYRVKVDTVFAKAISPSLRFLLSRRSNFRHKFCAHPNIIWKRYSISREFDFERKGESSSGVNWGWHKSKPFPIFHNSSDSLKRDPRTLKRPRIYYTIFDKHILILKSWMTKERDRHLTSAETPQRPPFIHPTM